MRHGPTNAPRGKLYAKYYNCMRSLKTSGLLNKSVKNSKLNTMITSRNITFS